MDEERFWSKVSKTDDGCWEWVGARNGYRYGLVRRNGRVERAHRVAYELAIGLIPSGMYLLHDCDNPPCVRPSHLRVGTQRDNLADMTAKGRRVPGPAIVARARNQRGTANYAAKLTEADVRDIRRLRAEGVPLNDLAARFGVTYSNISQIARRVTWTHLD